MSVKDDVAKANESWADKSRPAKVERNFLRGPGQVDDHAGSGGFLGRREPADREER